MTRNLALALVPAFLLAAARSARARPRAAGRSPSPRPARAMPACRRGRRDRRRPGHDPDRARPLPRVRGAGGGPRSPSSPTTPGTAIFDGGICEGKATLVLRGRSARVEGLVFTHMRVEDGNGAGIRIEQGDLDVVQAMFVDGQCGILSATDPNGTISDRPFDLQPARQASRRQRRPFALYRPLWRAPGHQFALRARHRRPLSQEPRARASRC